MKEITQRIGLYDLSIAFLIIANIAFGDNSKVYLFSQAVAFVMTILNVINNPRCFPKNVFYYLIWIICFSFAGLSSVLWASPENSTIISSSLSIMQVGMIAACIMYYINSYSKLVFVIQSFVCCAIVLSVRFFLTIPVSFWGNQARFENGTIFGQNSVSMALAFAAIYLFWFNVEENEKKLTPIKILRYFFAFLFIFISFLTGTKKSIIIFALGLTIIMLFKSANPTKLITNIIIVILLLLAGFWCIYNIPVIYNSIGYRIDAMLGLFNGGEIDRSTLMRLRFSQEALKTFKDHPLVGVGLDGFRYINTFERTYSHNNFTELLADLGIIGFSIYYSVYAVYLIKSFKHRKKEYLSAVLLLPLLIVHVGSVVYSMELEYIIFAIAVAALSCIEDNGNAVESEV